MEYFSPVGNTTGYIKIHVVDAVDAVDVSLSYTLIVGIIYVSYKKGDYNIKVQITSPYNSKVVTKLAGEKVILKEFTRDVLTEIFNNELTAEEICFHCRFILAENQKAPISYTELDGRIVYL